MAEEGTTSGNGYAAPFGDSKGATQAAGPSTGANNFLENPAGTGTQTGGRDFTKENLAQKPGNPADRYCPDSVPDGGDLPFEQNDATERAEMGRGEGGVGQVLDTPKQKPFKLSGG